MIRLVTVLLVLFIGSCKQDDKVTVVAANGADGVDGQDCQIEETDTNMLIKCGELEPVVLSYQDSGNTSSSNSIEACKLTDSKNSFIICGNVNFNGLPKDGTSCTVEPTSMGAKIVCEDGTEAVVFNGVDGTDGKDGLNGSDGKDGSNGTDGKDGLNGSDGKDGINGTSCKVVDHPSGAEIKCGNSSQIIYDGKDGKCTNCCKKRVCEITKSGNHTVWFSSGSKNLPNDFIFSPFGVWEQDMTGLVRVQGYVTSQSKPELTLHIDIMFKSMTKVAPAGSPKQPNGNNLSDWYYYKNFSGIMVGEGELEGLVMEITQHGPVMQVGSGASIHNPLFGAASWFKFKVINQPNHGPKVYDSTGDFNWTLTCY